ncbi:zinc finger BED domain-containing protein 5-like [Centruroides sculpturatus]|uniref:zinc finger BED domain-containing protein 5-like n=1 Tax=Centruroides sculpturatus TaxID=218467 RepID=UPI000C6D7FA7|nr:zinc finger BED domain-containing protein 5-like [Centruroides sculpturatus]
MDKFLKRSQPSMSGTSGSDGSESKPKKNRHYYDNYLKYGFTVMNNKPQCVICGDVLSRESMKPSKLMRHLSTKHPKEADKPLDFFECKLKTLNLQQNTMIQVSSVNENALLASYRVAYRVAKAGKPHTDAENLILPAALDMVEIMLGRQEASKLKSIPLSDNTIERRINDMASDIREQVVEKLKKSPHFALQFDESTDVSDCAQFVVFVRFEADESITEDILFCKALSSNTTGQCLYDIFLESTRNYKIDWTKCIAICSDGAKAMTGQKSGLVAKLKSIMPNVSWTHCFLHRHALVAKVLPSDLNEVLKEVIKIVNSIKGKALQTRLFRIICEDMGSLHQNLLYHTEVRWLSKGKVLTRVLELKAELLMFLQGAKSEYANYLCDPVWLLKLAFLADLFSHLNILNKKLQGREENILTAKDKIKGFFAKLRLWSTSLQKNIYESFPCVQKIVEETAMDQLLVVSSHIPCMIQSLHNLEEKLLTYFPKLDSEADYGHRWILNPFIDMSVQLADLTTKMKENLIDLAADGMLKMEFHSQNIDVFWMKRKQMYPELARETLKLLVPFATSYLCEITFSSMVDIKTKKRNRLQLENDLVVCVSKNKTTF